MREVLRTGQPVQLKTRCDTIEPLVFSGDICYFHPIAPGCNSSIDAGDIIFCRVQPLGVASIHLVWRAFTFRTIAGVEKTAYIIGGQKTSNGWCYREHICGLLIRTSRGESRPIGQDMYT